MAITQRFSAIDKAVLVSTGNSFMVCGSSTEPDVNTSDLIKIDGTTTRNWSQCGSEAILNILADSTVLYAELVWYSTVFSNVSGALDLRSIGDNQITFTTPKGSYQISPQYTDSYTGISGTVDRYRATDVTSYVQAALSGNYSVSKVPISLPSTGLSNSRGGWSLSVIYRNDSLKPQKILYNSGISVATPSIPFQTALTGFSTSSDPNLLKSSITMVCANGQPLNGNEYAMAGTSFANLINIGNSTLSPNPNPGTTPNNPGNSFFSGTINVADPLNQSNGLLNINGTKGISNNDGFVPTQLIGARNKWDITNVDISNTLVTNQTLICGQITTGASGDGIQLISIGTQVYSKAPNIITTLEAYDIDGDLEYNVEVGEAQVYVIKIKNDGDVDANNMIVSSILNSSTSFIPGSVIINGINNPTANIINGINIGTIDARGIVTILFTVRVDSLPSGGILYQNVNYSYQFISGLDRITNSGVTNTISLIVQEGNLTVTKVASKSSLFINDTVTYTITIQNTGTEVAKEILFQDKIDVNSSFIPETVIINGVPYTEYNPFTGFVLPDMPVGYTNQIVFQVKVNSLPISNKISNLCFVTFGYLFDQYGYLRKNTVVSNSTNITVQHVSIIDERCNNNNYPKVNDTVTYTLSLTNMGNIPATAVEVLEPIVPGATFVNGSVKINSTSQPSLNPFEGFSLNTPIQPLQTSKVEYKVLINSLNPESLIQNTANIPFKYQIVPGGTTISAQKNSNTVNTITNYVCINSIKSVNTAYSEIGDTLYYKVQTSNSGNINATNTVFLDSLQSNLSFISGSVAINGIPYPSYNPTIGFTLGTICPDETVEVTFQANVNSRPIPNVIYNNGSVVYNYQPDPNGGILTNNVFTNTVETTINEAKYSITKTVDNIYAHLNDYLVYTTTIQNTGTVPLTNIKFADFIDIFLEFVEGTVYINGIHYPNYDPNEQFLIPDMNPGNTATIIFGVKIIGYPPIGYVQNMSEVTLTYKQNPNSPIITTTVYSNIVKTYIPIAKVDLVKTVDKLYSNVGDTLTYSFTATNSGNSNAINTFFTDILQEEVSFLPGSVLINGVNKANYNPNIGFPLGSMATGKVVTIEFKATVNSVPNPNTIKNNATASYSYYVDPAEQPVTQTSTSNIVTTIINSYSATLSKAVDKTYATIGDILSYTITTTNTGTVTLTNVTLRDLIPTGATFVDESVIIDGVSKPTFNPNLGFQISNVLPGGNVVVMFKAAITSIPTIPQINNIANINFKYQLTPTSPSLDGSLTSNTVTTNIRKMSVSNTKSVSTAYATINDTLTYTSVISNTGNVSLNNTSFIDNLDNNINFVPGSIKINGVSFSNYDPNIGFTLGTINQNSTVTVTFDVIVKTLPPNGVVTNSSNLNYEYKIDPNAPYIRSNVTSNNVTTYINLGNLTVTKASDRNIVRLTNIITYSFVISNTGNTLLQNLLFKDIVQLESSFNSGTVYVNGVNHPNYNPNTGFNLNNLAIGENVTITFQVTANSIPNNNELLNTANISYSYYVDPNGSITTKTKTSNTTTVYVYDTIISANKTVDKAVTKLGETLNFVITLKNEGNVPAQQVIFKDLLDTNISFITDSVYINGVQNPGYDPNVGFSLNNIGINTTTTVSFSAKVNSRPINNIITNFAKINYEHLVGSDIQYATINTNTTETYIAVGEVTVTKSVTNSYATVDDNLYYTVIIKNTGSVNATNLIFKDLIPIATSFNIGTVVVDSTPRPTFNPNTGFTLSDLAPNAFHTISFNIHVGSLPQSGKVDNTADLTFTYKLTEIDPPVTTTTHSNTVTTLIKIGILISTKEVDKTYATIGDTLNYTITVNNTGNSNCFDVLFRDILQSNASFVTGSVKINGVTYSNYNPNTGFILSDIPGFGVSVVTFSATVQSLPQDYTIYNFATSSYKYYVDPTNPPILDEKQSNTVQTIINVGKIIPTKTVSKSYATIDDILTYTVNIFNAGNTIAKNINFRDVLPIGINFITGSVQINGISYPNANPFDSFTLGNIISGDTVVVTFQAKIISLPNPSLVSNTANITFFYKVNPSGEDIPVTLNSNTVTTQVNSGSLNLAKTVNKGYVTIGDVVTYTIIVSNNGNITAENVIFTDNLQSDINFNQGSVKVNGTTHPDYDPNQGFSLGNIEALNNITIVFTATVIQNPINSSILNHGIGTFSYKIDPNGQYYSKSSISNIVSTIIIKPALSATKTVNKSYATLQDNLNYSILVKNEGNTTISQIFFADNLSNGAIFQSGTVKVNGTNFPTYNPITGFNLSDLIAGNTALIEFQSTVTTLPEPPQITNYAVSNGIYYVDPQGPSYPITATSNIVSTNINIGSLSNTKSVDKMYAKVDDTLNYTSIITNTGNINVTNLFFTDILQSALSFVSGTVTINSVVYPSLNPIIGFNLSNLAPGQNVTVGFSAKINSLPIPASVTNTSNVNFSYKLDPTGPVNTNIQSSNPVTTNVVLGKLTVLKNVDKSIATIGDELTYSVTLTNVGTVVNSNLFFQDILPSGVAFKAHSVIVNNVNQPTFDPIVGFNLGDIGVGNVITIIFVATVVSVPPTNTIVNQAVVNFKFVVDPKQPPYNDTTYSNTVTTNIAYGNLNVTKATNKEFATIGEEITYTITIVNIGNIDANNVVFLDPTPHNSTFVIRSVNINGISYPDFNPSVGFALNTMTPGQIITVVYKVQVIELC
ncbi:hypothetical protein ACQPU1_12270 [Clostridium paraputrificum]|uniref:hypothetical protein n=1 Tax=Clostridium paraputrificum TaxID=29363 RepID=UPI003D34A991